MKSERLNLKINKKSILMFLTFNIAIWIVSAVFDFAFGPLLCNLLCIPQMYHTDIASFIDVLLMNIPPMLLLHRILIMLIFYFLSLCIYFYVILKKLRISEQNLFNSNKSKNRLFGIIAHDLRSPFNELLGLTEILNNEHKDLSNEELHEITDSLMKSTKNLYNFLDDMLIWAKTQMKQIIIENTEIDMYEVAEILGRLYEQNLKNKNITYLSEIPKGTMIQSDRNILDTVMRNLISNAIKFTKNGGEIKIGFIKDENKNSVISVIDNGVGISEEGLSNVFKIDAIFTNPGTNGEKGTGLGLILCKDLIEMVGGSISITSKIDSGTIVSIKI
jgi:signal transduction histidine kinase